MSKIKFTELISFVGTTPVYFDIEKKYISTGAVDKFLIDEKEIEMITYANRPSRANLAVRKDDIIFAKMAETLKTLYINDELAENVYSTGFCAVRANEGKITPQCLYYLVSSPAFLTQKDKHASGATQRAITNSGMQNIMVNVPPLTEQKNCVKKLDTISLLIAYRKKQLEKLDLLVKSQFIEMFGDPVSNSLNWETVCLGDLGELNRGISKARPRNSPDLLGGVHPLVQTGEVANSDTYISSYTNTYSDRGLAQSRKWKKGTLCITIAANIAQTGILTFDACFPDSVVGFIAKERTSNIFIHYWFMFFQKLLEEQAPQVAQKNINLKILKNLKVIVPPIELQNKFARFVEQIDKSKFASKQSLEKLETLKKALMQKYFG